MRTALTSAEKNTWRARPQTSQFYAATHQPRIIWAGSVNAIPDNYPASAITASNTLQGNLSDVQRGMTVRIGTNIGMYDKGKMRVRATPTAASLLHVGEFGSGIARWNGAIATIVEEYAPVSIHPSYDTATSAWLVDLDPFTAQTLNYGPLALLGPPAVVWLDGGTGAACYVGDRSLTFTGGVSITSQSWQFSNGVTVSSALGSSLTPVIITYNNASSSGRYHTLTVTDGNGASHIGQRLTFAFNSSNAQPAPIFIEEIAGGLESGGYDGRIQVFGNGASDNFPEGAQIVIFERASYNGIASSLGGNYFGRNNIVFVGWIVEDSTRIEPFGGNVSFRVATIDRVLAQSDNYDVFLESGSAASAWDMASGLTIDKAALTLVKYRSTVANVTDVNFAGDTASRVELAFRSLPQTNIWEQLRYNYDALLGLVASDMQSSIYATLDTQVTGASASLPVITDIAAADRRDIVTIEHPHFDTNSQNVLYAIQGGLDLPIGAVSPSHRVGHFGGRQEISRNLTAPDTDTVITWAGNLRAKLNNPYKRVAIPFSGNLRLDPVPQSRITMSLSPTATNNVRGLNWNNQSLIPAELRVSQDPRTMYAMVDIVAETVVDGHGGSSVDFPPAITPLPTPTPTPIPGPGGGGGTGGLVYFVTNTFIGRTRNWNATSPSWVNVTGVITGTIVDFILDPYDPQNKAWVCTATTIYRTTNLDSAIPTWAVMQTQAQIETGVGGAIHRVSRIVSSIEQNGRFSVLVRRRSADYPINHIAYTGTTTNNGSSWTWTLVRASADSNSAIDYADHSGALKIVVPTGAPNTDTLFINISTNGGSSYTSQAMGNSGRCLDVLCPYNGNDSDSIIYVVTNDPNDLIMKSSDNGATWSNVAPTGFSIASNAANAGFNGFLIGDATNLYLCSCDSTSPLWKTSDGGLSWIQVNSNLGANARTIGLWPYDSNKIYVTITATGQYFSTNGGVSFVSKAGNWATAIGSIANSFQLTPVWTI